MVGTVGVITPWNWPVIITCWQLASALRMGNAVVLNEALPPGVLTTVTGAGAVGNCQPVPADAGARRQRRRIVLPGADPQAIVFVDVGATMRSGRRVAGRSLMSTNATVSRHGSAGPAIDWPGR